MLNRWINRPEEIEITEDHIQFKVLPKTDFWQVTHYGFSRTDGNCYTFQPEDDIEFKVRVKMNYRAEFDQAGVIVYLDENNFAKLCIENQLKTKNKLGSVVTKNRRSDWATQNIDDIDYIYYRVSRRGINYRFEYSLDDKEYIQVRLFDIDLPNPYIGIFGASPLGNGFLAEFSQITTGENQWRLDQNDIPDDYK